MTRAEALRKLLALGPMDRTDIEQCTRWQSADVAEAIEQLRTSRELRHVKDGSQRLHFGLTDTARARAFAQGA